MLDVFSSHISRLTSHIKGVLHMAKKGKISVQEAGRKGGARGGKVTASKYGHEFYEEIGHKGGQKVRDLINKGKKSL